MACLQTLSPILSWDFDPFLYSTDQLLQFSFTMFQAFDLCNRFNIDAGKLQHFLSDIASHYRDNPYHNFRHGFSTLHCAFMICTHRPEFSSSVAASELELGRALSRSSATGIGSRQSLQSDVTEGASSSSGSFTPCSKLLTRADLLALFVACICHDVDHPGTLPAHRKSCLYLSLTGMSEHGVAGTNNTFSVNCEDELALRYNDQVHSFVVSLGP